MGSFEIVGVKPGKFITFEGGEGAGKSTQVKRLAAFLASHGNSVVETREPGGSPGAEEIRRLLVEGSVEKWDAISETLLLMAGRRSHLRDLVDPALQRGDWVLCDRFSDSTIAYQGYGQGMDIAIIREIQRLAIGDVRPDLTLLLDISAEEGLGRAAARGDAARYERMDIDMHHRIRDGFLEMASNEPERFDVIDAQGTVDAIENQIRNCIERRFGLN